MKVVLHRLFSEDKSTLGLLSIDGENVCFTLEDVEREVKIPSVTAIPQGTYAIKLRDEGGMTKSYKEKYGLMHRGMLWLQDVNNFEWVYIHTGNTDEHTDGCILVGNSADIGKEFIGSSVDAYKNVYPRIASAIEDGEEVTIEVTRHP